MSPQELKQYFERVHVDSGGAVSREKESHIAVGFGSTLDRCCSPSGLGRLILRARNELLLSEHMQDLFGQVLITFKISNLPEINGIGVPVLESLNPVQHKGGDLTMEGLFFYERGQTPEEGLFHRRGPRVVLSWIVLVQPVQVHRPIKDYLAFFIRCKRYRAGALRKLLQESLILQRYAEPNLTNELNFPNLREMSEMGR